MSVAYESLDIGNGTAVFKTGPQCTLEASNYRGQTQNDPRLWNLLSMYIQGRSQDLNLPGSQLYGSFSLNATSLRLDAVNWDSEQPCLSSSSSEVTSAYMAPDDKRNGGPGGDEQQLDRKERESHSPDCSVSSALNEVNVLKTDQRSNRSDSSTLTIWENEGTKLSSSSSSIGQPGQDSSFSSEVASDASDYTEIQSPLRGPLDLMSSLESSLPIKRGLSRFFGGKSRSFTSLGGVSSVTDLAKPDNPYAKRRKGFQLLGSDRHKSFPPLSRISGTGIAKRSTSVSKSSLAVALLMESNRDREREPRHKRREPYLGFVKTSAPSPCSYSLTDIGSAKHC